MYEAVVGIFISLYDENINLGGTLVTFGGTLVST